VLARVPLCSCGSVVCRLSQLALEAHVTVVESAVTGIDRQHSTVLLHDGTSLPYARPRVAVGTGEIADKSCRYNELIIAVGMQHVDALVGDLRNAVCLFGALAAEQVDQLVSSSFAASSAPAVMYGAHVWTRVFLMSLTCACPATGTR
jgi:NADH dehydrogenase FAD-containing subunit